MNQVSLLEDLDVQPFAERIVESTGQALSATKLGIVQVNVGYLCNLTCKHCHVEAGPKRTEVMSQDIMQQILRVIDESDAHTVDITGGAPEMNPHFRWFVSEIAKRDLRIIVRSNLSILTSTKFQDCIDLFVEHGVEVVASVPDPGEARTDNQRGDGVFQKIIRVMAELNSRGYGQPDSNLQLHLVHNPVGAYLPGDQTALESEYHRKLDEEFGVQFNHLFCITNIPVGRYLEYLARTDQIDDYVVMLANAYNSAAASSVMCRDTLSIAWDGRIYDCDFNQMLGLGVDADIAQTIGDLCVADLIGRPIQVHNACHACVAGAGSSCQGTTT